MSQPWSDLPNAAHIDRILVDVRARPEAWVEAWAAACAAAEDAAWDAILALVAWDDCAHLLDTDPDQVRVLALLGQPAAVPLYPACCALKSSNKSMAYSA